MSDPDILGLVRAGNLIMAIKLFRERYGGGLAEAKAAVEAMRDGSDAPLPQRTAFDTMTDQAFASTIEGMLLNNNAIQAIKIYRERFGCGLKEAKDSIDGMMALLKTRGRRT